MWRDHQAKHTTYVTGGDGNEAKKYTGVSRAVFFRMAKQATARKQKTLAGLDNISFRYGSENFDTMRDLVARVVSYGDLLGLPFQVNGSLHVRSVVRSENVVLQFSSNRYGVLGFPEERGPADRRVPTVFEA